MDGANGVHYLIKRLEGDVVYVELLDGLEVDGEMAWVDAGEVETKGKTTTLTKLNFPGTFLALLDYF